MMATDREIQSYLPIVHLPHFATPTQYGYSCCQYFISEVVSHHYHDTIHL